MCHVRLVTRSPHVRCNSNSTVIVLDQLHNFIPLFSINVQDMLLHSIMERTLEKRLNGRNKIKIKIYNIRNKNLWCYVKVRDLGTKNPSRPRRSPLSGFPLLKRRLIG